MPAGWPLFLLGLSAGVSLLPITVYRRVSPRWLAWALIVSGLLVMSRYFALAFLVQSPTHHIPSWAGAARCWFSSLLGWVLPGACAVDQLLRHPAMTPSRLVRWVAPILLLHGVLLALAQSSPLWSTLMAVAHIASVIGFIGVCVLCWITVPVRSIRIALGVLMLAAAALVVRPCCVDGWLTTVGFDGRLPIFVGWSAQLMLFSDLLASLALWYAYETAEKLLRNIS